MGYSGITAPEFEDASVALCAAVSRRNGESVWKDLCDVYLRTARARECHVEVLSAANYGWTTLHQPMITSGERLYFTLGPRVVYNNILPLVGTGGVTNQIN